MATDYDVMVIGAGPGGIAAACVCAEGGRRVALVDQSFRAGGQIWRHRSREQTPADAQRWLERLDASAVERLFETTVVSIDNARAVTLVKGERVQRVRASVLVLATGARELFLPFPGWTLPWVLGAGGAQALLKEGVSFAGKRVVVSGSGPLLLPVAASLAKSGARVSHVLEQADMGSLARFSGAMLRTPSRLFQAAGYARAFGVTRYRTGSWVVRAFGEGKLESVEIRSRGMVVRVPCDVLCTGFGLIPSVELAQLVGCAVSDGAVKADAGQATSVPNVFCVGETTGVAGVDSAVAQGVNAAHSILGRSVPSAIAKEVQLGKSIATQLAHTFRLRPEVLNLAEADTVVCRCEDVRERSIDRTLSWRELKLRTRIGMGPCQGRICGGAMHARFGIQQTDARAPIFPAPIAALMGADPE